MYNFYFGTPDEIRQDEETFLLAIKRMLPRWANSLTDSSYTALVHLMDKYVTTEQPVMVETGIGASTVLFVHYAMKRGGKVLSWDMNPSKGTFVRQVLSETLEQYHGKAISNHWTFVASDSLCPHLGLTVVGELTDKVDLTMHDSNHTWKVVSGEIDSVVPHLADPAIVCVDDAHQTYLHTYEPIINVGRRKLGLEPIAPLEGNSHAPLYRAVPEHLSKLFSSVEQLNEPFQRALRDDLYFSWYATDRKNMASVGMERMDELEKRFISMRVSERIGNA